MRINKWLKMMTLALGLSLAALPAYGAGDEITDEAGNAQESWAKATINRWLNMGSMSLSNDLKFAGSSIPGEATLNMEEITVTNDTNKGGRYSIGGALKETKKDLAAEGTVVETAAEGTVVETKKEITAKTKAEKKTRVVTVSIEEDGVAVDIPNSKELAGKAAADSKSTKNMEETTVTNDTNKGGSTFTVKLPKTKQDSKAGNVIIKIVEKADADKIGKKVVASAGSVKDKEIDLNLNMKANDKSLKINFTEEYILKEVEVAPGVSFVNLVDLESVIEGTPKQENELPFARETVTNKISVP